MKSYKRLPPWFMIASAFLPALALSTTLLVPTMQVQAAEAEKAECKTYSVLLTKEGNGEVPANLSFLHDTFQDEQFSAYQGYRLLETTTLKLDHKKPSLALMKKTGHRLSLQFLGVLANKLKIHAILMAPNHKKPLVDTDYLSVNNGLLLVDGAKPADGNGRVFFAIQCRTQ